MLTSINQLLGDPQAPYLKAEAALIAIDHYLDNCLEYSDLITPELITEEDRARTQVTIFNAGKTISGALYVDSY